MRSAARPIQLSICHHRCDLGQQHHAASKSIVLNPGAGNKRTLAWFDFFLSNYFLLDFAG
jgi:hypothetical protein